MKSEADGCHPQNREKARKMEEAVSMRKRSSRIAVKELENEQAAKVAAEAEAERELRARAARAEARQRAEDERREREEEKRLARIAEREERAAQREAQIAYEKEQERKRQERRRLRAEGRAIRVATREAENSVHATTGEEEDWELDCRICGVVGKNMVRPSPRRSSRRTLTFGLRRTMAATSSVATSAASGA